MKWDSKLYQRLEKGNWQRKGQSDKSRGLSTFEFFDQTSLLQARSALAAENLFLRKQLALYQERQVRPRRATDATRLIMILAARLFDWKETLVMVRPQTFTRWHRQGFKLFWRWKSRPIGRPRIPEELRQLILAMARDNPTWGQERIAAELFVKLGIQVSPRTIRKYLPENPQNRRRHTIPTQRWMTFVRNHARTMLACDFFVSVTVGFQILYVFVMMEVGSRRLAHFNVTSHPTAAWTSQQFREVIDNQQAYRFVIHDRDKIYSQDLDLAVRAMGVRIRKTPFHSPKANSHCERLVGGLRRDCLDFLIPISERHLKGILKDWTTHYWAACEPGTRASRAGGWTAGSTTAKNTTSDSGGISSEGQTDSWWSSSRVSAGEGRRLRMEDYVVRCKPSFTMEAVSSGVASDRIDESNSLKLSAFLHVRVGQHC